MANPSIILFQPIVMNLTLMASIQLLGFPASRQQGNTSCYILKPSSGLHTASALASSWLFLAQVINCFKS